MLISMRAHIFCFLLIMQPAGQCYADYYNYYYTYSDDSSFAAETIEKTITGDFKREARVGNLFFTYEKSFDYKGNFVPGSERVAYHLLPGIISVYIDKSYTVRELGIGSGISLITGPFTGRSAEIKISDGNFYLEIEDFDFGSPVSYGYSSEHQLTGKLPTEYETNFYIRNEDNLYEPFDDFTYEFDYSRYMNESYQRDTEYSFPQYNSYDTLYDVDTTPATPESPPEPPTP